MSLTRTQIIITGAVVFILLLIIGIIVLGGRDVKEKPPEIKLTIWGIEPKKFFYESLSDYENFRPNVQVRYTEINPATYENDLLNAMAAGTGPDIFMFKNNWLPKHHNKIRAVGESQFNLVQLQQLFPTVAEQDFTLGVKQGGRLIFALPLHIDTLALYYNTDIFNTGGVAFPPTNWLEFQNLVPKLRQIDNYGNITRPAAAIGGSERTVDTATDILSLLMIQTGTKMTDDNFTQATFSRYADQQYPGLTALSFYTNFADPTNTLYTWNDNLGYSLDSFAQGKTAMIFNYDYQKEALKKINPFLNFQIAPMPQPAVRTKDVNYASYWGLAVSNKSAYPEWAWDLAIHLTTNDSTAEKYLKASNQPPALRSLIQKYINDPKLGIFAKQALSAQSWPQIDEKLIADVFSRMIIAVNNKQLKAKDALYQAEKDITNAIRAK